MAALCPSPVPFSIPIPPAPAWTFPATNPTPLAVRLRQAATDIPSCLAADLPPDRREALRRLEAARTTVGQLAEALLEAERRGRLSWTEAEGIARRLRDTRLHLRRMRQCLDP